jgi:hypothetical protein
MNLKRISLFLAFAILLSPLLTSSSPARAGSAQTPRLQAGAPPVVSYQGQVTVDGAPYNGAGYFKFAVVDQDGNTTWSNDGTPSGEPAAAVSVTVSSGLFNVLLGDTSLSNMIALPASAFDAPGRFLRVWFSSDGSTFTQLSPDRPIAAVPYSLQAQEASHAVETDHALNADQALTADQATEAGHALSADNALTADQATDASHALNADTALTADQATEANHAITSDQATEADHATNADNAANANHAANADNATNAGALNNQPASYYLDASNIYAGPLSPDYYSAYIDLTAEGYLDASTGTDLLTIDLGYQLFGGANHSHWGQIWNGFGTGLTLSGGDIGLLANGSNLGVQGTTTSGTGVYGNATATTGTTYGVYGNTASESGFGVYGNSTATSGMTYGVSGNSASTSGYGVFGNSTAATGGGGVFGYTASNSGRGVWGNATATSGVTYGVLGTNNSSAGVGVFGLAASSSGTTYGIYGESLATYGFGVSGTSPWVGTYGKSESNYGTGVSGVATSTTGNTVGVYGASGSTSGKGVYGLAPASTGTTYGVQGNSSSSSGYGVYGSATSTTGTTYGVYGNNASPLGTGVYGNSTATSGQTFGVVGKTVSTNGLGVFGSALASTGTNYGVFGQSESTSGYGGYFLSNNENAAAVKAGVYGRDDTDGADTGYGVAGHAYFDGVGVGAWSYTGVDLIRAFDGDYPGGTLRFRVERQSGNVYADGTFNTFKRSSTDGEFHSLVTIEATEQWIEDFGKADLVDGYALVTILPDFAGLANLTADYHVFLTPYGDSQGLYVTNLTATSFEVREQNAGKSSLEFSFRIVARPFGAAIERLPVVEIPEPVSVDRSEAPLPGMEPQP